MEAMRAVRGEAGGSGGWLPGQSGVGEGFHVKEV